MENEATFKYTHSSKQKFLFEGEVSRDDLFLTDDQRIAKQTDKICSDFLNQTWSWPNSETMDGTDFSRPSRKRFSKRLGEMK